MKKYVLLCLFLATAISATYAEQENKIPSDFYSHCFQYNNYEIPNIEINPQEVYKMAIFPSQDLVITQADQLVPYKKYIEKQDNIVYSNSLNYDFATLNDNNDKTYVEYDTQNAEIVLDLSETLIAGSFEFKFKYKYVSWMQADFFVSENGRSYSKIVYNGPESLEKYNIKKLKIAFSHISGNRDIFQISELSFNNKYDVYLVAPLSSEPFDIYSMFHCKEWSVPYSTLKTQFSINNNTKNVTAIGTENPAYHPQSSVDSDGDGIQNSRDNCRTIYNPIQTDSNGDGIWDFCSDDDRDTIIWHKDNCIHISNRDQRDINQNGVWDVCEFDKDNDGIYDSLDNCITTPNPNQEDADQDRIWDICDNCTLYNPDQADINNNNKWDVCDKRNFYLSKNDQDNDGIENSKDNCIDIANSDQEDSDNDGVWNLCDNCSNIQNTEQLDLGQNGIWDMCEDSDNDGIEWFQDNCINTPNSDQQDSDNNGIWNVCEDKDKDNIIFALDNCPHVYNPNQQDIDNDTIWDSCDTEDNRYIESNKGVLITLIIIFILIFLWGIYILLKKLQTQ